MAFVRTSKFRHVFGQAAKSDFCYNGIMVEGTGDTNGAINGKFIAIIKITKVFILPMEETGRKEYNKLPFLDCKSKVLEVQWSPFNDYLLASGEESGDINIWEIPEGGLKDTLREPVLEIHGVHIRKVTCLQWHPAAENILAVSGADEYVSVFHVFSDAGYSKVSQTTVGQNPMPTNIAWNRDGSVLGVTAKNGRSIALMLINPRTGEFLEGTSKKEVSDGLKSVKLCFLNNGDVLTCGSDRSAARSIFIWGKDDLEEKFEFELTEGGGVYNMYYDYDLDLLYLFAKGESMVLYYEVNETEAIIYYLSSYSAPTCQKGGNFLPKRHVTTSEHEIARFYKFQPTKCEPISFTVPRKSDKFQKDLYPDCPSGVPALTAEKWIEGQDLAPLKASFEDISSGKVDAKKPTSYTASSIRSAAKAIPKNVPSADHANLEGIDLAGLLEDMKKVKATVRKLNKRVAKLEEALDIYTGGADGEE